MLQRQQTLWLLLSTICAVLSYLFPFYTGQLKDGKYFKLDAGHNFILLILMGASILLSGIIIFLFKDRKLQFRLSLSGIALSIIMIIIYFTQIKKFQTGSFSLSCLLTFAILIGFVMAVYRIRRDEKLAKSLDRLR